MGTVEDTHHFVMHCPKYEGERKKLIRQVIRELAKSNGNISAVDFAFLDPTQQFSILFGKRIGDPKAEDRIDRIVKRFLNKCWNLRKESTQVTDDGLFTNHEIYPALVA